MGCAIGIRISEERGTGGTLTYRASDKVQGDNSSGDAIFADIFVPQHSLLSKEVGRQEKYHTIGTL